MREHMRGSVLARTASFTGRVLLSALVLAAIVALSHGAHADTTRLVLLHSNDSHGHLFAPDGGDVMGDTGGIARTATIIQQTREAYPGHVLVVHAGDVLSRGDTLTIATQGKLDFRLMKRIGYEVFVPGNGEFYSGLDAILACQRTSGLPMLYANVTVKATGKRPFPPYLVRTVAGVRVGILGLGVIRMEHPASAPLTYLDPVEEARHFVPVLREKSDVVMVLSHLGIKADRALAAAVPGIDLIVGGHSHTKIDVPEMVPGPNGQGTVAIAQAGDYGRYIGRLDLAIERTESAAPRVTIEGKLITLDASVAPDPTVVAFLDHHLAPLRKAICESPVDLPNPETGESPLAQWMAEQVRRATGTDVAIMLRDESCKPIVKGPITRAEACRMYSYPNRVCLVDMTVAQVRAAMESEKSLVATPLPSGRDTYRVAIDQFTRGTTPTLKPLPFTTTRQRVDAILLKALRRGHFETAPPVHARPLVAKPAA